MSVSGIIILFLQVGNVYDICYQLEMLIHQRWLTSSLTFLSSNTRRQNISKIIFEISSETEILTRILNRKIAIQRLVCEINWRLNSWYFACEASNENTWKLKRLNKFSNRQKLKIRSTKRNHVNSTSNIPSDHSNDLRYSLLGVRQSEASIAN